MTHFGDSPRCTIIDPCVDGDTMPIPTPTEPTCYPGNVFYVRIPITLERVLTDRFDTREPAREYRSNVQSRVRALANFRSFTPLDGVDEFSWKLILSIRSSSMKRNHRTSRKCTRCSWTIDESSPSRLAYENFTFALIFRKSNFSLERDIY